MRKLFVLALLLCAIIARADSLTDLGSGILSTPLNVQAGTAVFALAPGELDIFSNPASPALNGISGLFCPTCVFLTGFIPDFAVTTDANGHIVASGDYAGLIAPFLFQQSGNPIAVNGFFSETFFGSTLGSRADFTITATTIPASSEIPEPGTWMLLATGLFGMAWKLKGRPLL